MDCCCPRSRRCLSHAATLAAAAAAASHRRYRRRLPALLMGRLGGLGWRRGDVDVVARLQSKGVEVPETHKALGRNVRAGGEATCTTGAAAASAAALLGLLAVSCSRVPTLALLLPGG